METYQVDLNCDMGESFGIYTLGQDEQILDYISSANIACGFHAGDPATMSKTVGLAMARGVAIGAHPGLPDRAGFGRRTMDVTATDVYELVVYQIGALAGFTRAAGGRVHHVKPHGALYNMAAKSLPLATAVAEAVYAVDPEMVLFGLSGSALIAAGRKIGLLTASEVFADRTYQEDGTLTPRSEDNALIQDQATALNQVLRMVKTHTVVATTGTEIPITAQTICIHGDGAHALAFARYIREHLQMHQVQVTARHEN